MSLSSWFAFISRKIWQWMSAWRAHVLEERSYPPNSTETQAYHQISACRTRPDRVWYGIISVWHWKGHMRWRYWWADIISSNSITMEQMKTSWPLRHLRCCLLRIHSSSRWLYSLLPDGEVENGGLYPVWMACRRWWHTVVSNHTYTWCLFCTANHSASGQV